MQCYPQCLSKFQEKNSKHYFNWSSWKFSFIKQKTWFPVDTDIFKIHRTTKSNVLTTSGRRSLIYDILKTSDVRRLKDVRFTTTWRRLICDVLKTSDSRRLRDVGLRRLEDVLFTTSWRCLIYDVLKVSKLRRLEYVWFMSFGRRLICDVLRTSVLLRLEDVCKTTSVLQRRSDVYNTSKEMTFSYLVLSEKLG